MVRLEQFGGPVPFVVGLAWDALSEGVEVDRDAIMEAGTRVAPGSQHGVVVKGSRRVSVGFVPVAKKTPAKAYSAISGAAVLAAGARHSNKSFICVQRCEDGRYWVCSATPEYLTNSSDKVLEETAAVEWLEKALADSQSANGFDATWTIFVSGTREFEASPAFNKAMAHKAVQVVRFGTNEIPRTADLAVSKMLGVSKGAIVAVVAVVALIVLAGLGKWYLSYRATQAEILLGQQALEMQAIEREQLKTLKEVRLKQALVDALSEDTMTLDPKEFIDRCWDVGRSLGVTFGGWAISDVKCEAPVASDQLRVAFTLRLGANVSPGGVGTSRELIAAAAGIGSTVNFVSDRQASINVVVPSARRRAQVDSAGVFPKWVDVIKSLGSVSQMAGRNGLSSVVGERVDRTILFKDPEKQSLPPEKQMVPLPPELSYQYSDWVWTGAEKYQLPGVAFSLGLPYVTIQSMDLKPTAASFGFSIRGRVYVVR